MWHYLSVALALYKAFAVIVILFSIAGMVYVIVKSGEARRRRPKDELVRANTAMEEDVFQTPHDLQNTREFTALRDMTIARWRSMEEQLTTEERKDYKKAIIEADALVDAALRTHGFSGETMGERMREVTRDRLPSIEDLWQAHRVRNAIAHDPHYMVSLREGHDTMQIYKKVLEDLGAL